MALIEQCLFELLKKVSDMDVYRHFLPADTTLPALTFQRISCVRSRVLSGETDFIRSGFQLELHAPCFDKETFELISKIQKLDGSSTEHFQYITIENEHPDPTREQHENARYIFDLLLTHGQTL